MHHTDKHSQHNSIIWPVWLNGRVFIYELNGYGLQSRCCHLNFRYGTCFKQGVPFDIQAIYRVWIHSETYTWHDNNIQSNAPYKWVLTTQLNYLAGLAKLFSVCLQTKWFQVRISFFSLILHRHWKIIYKCQIKKSQ